MPRIALSIAYDGRDWLGWQTQPSRKTIQDELERAILCFAGSPHGTICAGRTDAGVHALGQIIHLDTEIIRPDHAWIRGLNAHLPDSIAVQWAKQVSDDFHARFSACSRSYLYVIHNAPNRHPLLHGRAGWVYQQLDAEKMTESIKQVLGVHDFSSFRSSQCQAATPIRTILSAGLERKGNLIFIRFCANAFLHHMVRNLVGALVMIGQGREPVSFMNHLLEVRDRTKGAPTFSPAGLYFLSAAYPDHDLPANAADLPLFGV